jgi:general secretion pathway protein H
VPALGIEGRLPADEIELLAADDGRRERGGSIRFYPDGGSSGGTLVIGRAPSAHRIAVDWLTGRVDVDG